MTYNEFIAQGGTPNDWWNMPENGGAGTPAAQPNMHGTGPNVDASGNPVGTDYNPAYFANDTDAAQLAQQYGGTVLSAPLREAGGGNPASPYTMPNANYIQMPNGAVVNAGQIQNWQNLGQTANIQNELKNPMPTTGTGDDSWYSRYAPTAAAAQAASGTPAHPPAGGALGAPSAPGAPGSTGATGGVGAPGGIPGGHPSDQPASTYPNLGLPNGTPTQAAPEGQGLTNGIFPGGYGVGQPADMPNGAGAIGGTPTTFAYKNSNNVGDILSNDRQYAYGQGGELIGNYGQGLAQYQQRSKSLGAVGDSVYANLLQNPGYTADQAAGITNQAGLDALTLSQDQANSNFLTPEEMAAAKGNPNAGLDTYNAQAENLRQDARNFQGQVAGVYDNGATDLNTATGNMSQRLDDSIDPSQLGLSSEYQQNYNFGPEQQQAMIEDAGRTVGQGTAAVTDQLQRQANSAGSGSPLAMAAALDRQRQTGAVASADAMTKAKIQAAQLGLQTEQQKEQTRLGSAQDISSRRLQAATTAGQANIGNQQFLTSGRAAGATTTGKAYLDQSNDIANQQTNLATAADATSAQRAQALAQNRQTVNQANQTAQFTRGSYQDQAASQRATQVAGAARADQTAARQDIRNEEQTGLNESNSMMAGQLQAFSGVTGAGAASQSNAIKSAQLPTTLDKVVGAATGAASGLGFAKGGIVDKPTIATLGESGPEIVIKLNGMNYKRRNEVPTYAG